MPAITFKAKVQTVFNMDETEAFRYVKVPAITRSHCDMHAFRTHAKYGSYANSDLFPSLLKRALGDIAKRGMIRLDAIPENCKVDTSGFLAQVTIEI
jgi:hypothetical protein